MTAFNTNQNNMFAQPASGASFDIADHEGALLMITPTDFKEEISTSYGLSDAVEATIVVLDGPHEGETTEGALIFPKVLQGQLKRYVGTGQKALGRLGKGQAKPGQSAPWKLAEFTPEDAQKAQAWITKNDTDAPF